jgi:hypothetical protein
LHKKDNDVSFIKRCEGGENQSKGKKLTQDDDIEEDDT